MKFFSSFLLSLLANCI